MDAGRVFLDQAEGGLGQLVSIPLFVEAQHATCVAGPDGSVAVLGDAEQRIRGLLEEPVECGGTVDEGLRGLVKKHPSLTLGAHDDDVVDDADVDPEFSWPRKFVE